MHRREMLQLTAEAACWAGLASLSEALAAASGTAGSKAKPRWRPAIGLNGFASSSWKYKKTYPIWEVLDFAARNGFEGVELMSNWPMGDYPSADDQQRVAALKRLYDSYGLTVFSLQMVSREAHDPDPEVRKRWLDSYRNRARLIKQLGGSCIGLWPSGPMKAATLDESIKLVGQSFGEAAKIGADLGLVTAFEIEPPFIFHSEDVMQRILQTAGPLLKVIYDPSHFDWISGSTGRPHEMLSRIGVDRIGYLQLCDSDGTRLDGGTTKHLGCGDGHIDILASMKTLIDGGFSGWAMIDAWETVDPYDASLKGKQAIDRAMAG
jgi:sugar phosphate isomerase/epimerase